MNRLRLLFLSLVLTSPLAAVAQHSSDAVATSVVTLPAEAKQFDFLIGQWQLEVHPKVSGLAAMIHGAPRLVGTWTAQRSSDGLGIEDEMRIMDASGNPITSNKSNRTFSKTEERWKITGLDVARSRTSESTAKWSSGEMHVEGHFTNAEGQPTLTRTRYYGITADGFHMQQDRSTDNGQSWEEGSLTIDAKRVAATATP